MQKITAQGSTYEIITGKNLIDNADKYLASYAKRRCAIITDEKVYGLYANRLCEAVKRIGIEPLVLTVPEGEESKCHEQLLKLYEGLLAASITRNDFIIALGGGVVGDLAGFCAATYLRGVDMVQIPTTLLAQVDSSVGGKVAVNMPQGKNLIGTFMQPALVLADSGALETLDNRQLNAGIAEIFKYGCIKDKALFARLNDAIDLEGLCGMVDRCCEIKGQYVNADPFDKGIRMELNFGHTLGHAIEKTARYGKVLHGEGVAIGMIHAAIWGEKLGVTPKGTSEKIKDLSIKLGLPTEIPASCKKENLIAAMMGDKKAMGGALNIIILEEIGRARIEKISKIDFAALAGELI